MAQPLEIQITMLRQFRSEKNFFRIIIYKYFCNDICFFLLQNIFSAGKSIESITMGILFGKELFKYEDCVSKHWPEFGQNGKENVKISDVFRHQSGLAWFTEPIPTVKHAWLENIKQNKIGEFIENQKLHFPQSKDNATSTKTEYHSQSRGLIINEIVRRLDPKVMN